MDLKSSIRTIPDWPKKGIMFRDITTLIKDAKAFRQAIGAFYERYSKKDIDYIAGIESRGFIFGSALAEKMGKGFIPIRKAGKLPHKTEKEEYSLEYGNASIEVHVDAVEKNAKILLVDDLIATGGSLCAAINLIEKLGGTVSECAVVIELPDLHGRKKIKEKNKELFSLVTFEGD